MSTPGTMPALAVSLCFLLSVSSSNAMLRTSSRLAGGAESSLENAVNLDTVETALLQMHKEGASLESYAPQIQDMIRSKMSLIAQKANSSQTTLDGHWRSLLTCSASAHSEMAKEWLTKPKTALEGCWSDLHDAIATSKQCEHDYEIEVYKLREAQQAFDEADSYPDHGHCNWKGDDDVQSYAKKHRDEFATKLSNWQTLSQKYTAAKGVVSTKRAQCDELTRGVTLKRESCDNHQSFLETSACDVMDHRGLCAPYTSCYKERHTAWQEADKSALVQEAENVKEYTKLLRLQCYLTAMTEGDNEAGTTSEKVDTCKTFSAPQDQYAFLQVTHYPTASQPMPTPKCNDLPAPDIPGTQEFAAKYFKHLSLLSEEVDLAECSARCCQGQYFAGAAA
eukprot:TRINITY_DN1176_c0_g2_i1.p1 TRINITY_DN1176_c0_g2~~TRINITY_DN1176_c0_g2_i1.p1  ORF type:complete len:423 (+),score=77.84 TRINITY_DN1176_c0_g2_i1:89-1270(+)